MTYLQDKETKVKNTIPKGSSMSSLLRLPRWSIMSLIFLTLILSVVILVKIWFPEFIPEDLFEKIFWTYVVLIFSAAVISKMTEYLKNMQDTPESDNS
jgi:hypothetical protein